MVARRGASRASSSMIAAAKLVALGALSVCAQGRTTTHLRRAQRSLQTATSTVDYVIATEGTGLVAGQVDGEPLQNADGTTPPTDTTSIAMGAVNNLAEYELYFIAPDVTGATGFTLTFIGELTGEAWEVEMYDFNSPTAAWVPAGTLTGITTAGWTTATMDFTADTALYLTPRSAGELEVKVRVVATGTQSGFLDYANVAALVAGSPTPTPQPPTASPAAPVATVAPVTAPTTAPAPVAVAAVQGVTATYTDATTGTVSAEEVVTILASAEGSTAAATAVQYTTTAAGAGLYEMYFTAPATVTETSFTVTLVAQLGTGATASHWKVEMLDFEDDWVVAGTMAGASAGAFAPIVFTIPAATPGNFVAVDATDGTREYMLRLTTEGATASETLYVDQAAIANGASGPTPAPATTAPATVAPVTVAPVTVAPVSPTTPSTGTAGIPEYVEAVTGLAIDASQEDGAALVSAEGLGTTATAIECASDATGAAQYDVFLSLPSPVVGDLTVSVTAKLGAGASASNWKVAMYNHDVSVDEWTDGVAITGVTAASYSTVNVVVPTSAATPPSQFVEPVDQQILIRLYADGATGVEALTLDMVSVTAGSAATVAPTPAGTTLAPTPLNTNVQVDLVPCIFSDAVITRDGETTGDAYIMNEFFKGFWTATQVTQVVGASTVLDLTFSPTYGKCNAVFAAFKPSAAQKAQLQAYSIAFKVRVVYFNVAETANDSEVMTRLGMQSNFIAPLTSAERIRFTGTEANSILPAGMSSNLAEFSLFYRPVTVSATPPAESTIKAQYADASGTVLVGGGGEVNAAIGEYIGSGALAGLEELHLFFDIAWFDMGSWAWAHYASEWCTRGVFQGERRFYLGAVVDDLFLTTGQWEFNVATENEGTLARLTGADLQKFQTAEAAVNTQFGSAVKTEHAFNGIGILDAVDNAWRKVEGDMSDIALLPKGQKQNPAEGMTQQLFVDWLSLAFNPVDGVPGMQQDFIDGKFDGDDLLARVRADLDAFYWQSHTLTHLARDNLGTNDCDIEDGGNVQMAVMFGLFDNDNYNWRSMTSPGITGLFNSNCLQSGANNLMKCYPGDNTFDGEQTSVTLVNMANQFHSLKTTVETNGLTGSQIVPRFATNVYYNCVTGDCLVNENEWIRRTVCQCEEKDPSKASGACVTGTGTACPFGLESFNAQASEDANAGPLEMLYRTEEQDSTRYILSGRRDKYMFHQANVVSTTWATSGNMAVDPVPTDSPSLLEYWYERVLGKMATFINTASFPIQTLKFDNLCQNFYDHEDLDGTGAVLTATKDTTGAIIDMTLAVTADKGAPIPLTVPTLQAASISTGALVKQGTEEYGADTTYIFAATTLNTPDLSKPLTSELAPIPQATATAAQADAAQANAEADAASENPAQIPIKEEAQEELEEVVREDGFVPEKIVQPDTTP